MEHHTEKHKLQVLLTPTNYEICFATLSSKKRKLILYRSF